MTGHEDLLVVDDSELVHKLQAYVAQKLGLTVAHAYDGLDALQLCRERRYRAILLDLNMPVMDGLTFLRTLRANEAEAQLPPVPVVIVSTEGNDGDILQALADGGTAYIKKPFTHDQIAALLSRLLGQAQSGISRSGT